MGFLRSSPYYNFNYVISAFVANEVGDVDDRGIGGDMSPGGWICLFILLAESSPGYGSHNLEFLSQSDGTLDCELVNTGYSCGSSPLTNYDRDVYGVDSSGGGRVSLSGGVSLDSYG